METNEIVIIVLSCIAAFSGFWNVSLLNKLRSEKQKKRTAFSSEVNLHQGRIERLEHTIKMMNDVIISRCQPFTEEDLEQLKKKLPK